MTKYKNKKMVLSLLSMLILNTFFAVQAQNNLDSISPDHSVSFTTMNPYGWTATRTNNKWVASSGNRGVHSTSSSMYATVVVPQGADGSISFTYRVSSQASYDAFYVTVDGVAIPGFNTGKSGTISETDVVYALTPGRHDIEWYYSKNDNTNAGEDAAFVSNVRFAIGWCPRPANLTLVTTTDTSAYITWSGQPEANIEYGPQGFVRGQGYADYVTDTFYTIYGLQPNTYYTVWVQCVCSNGDTSVWEPVSFRTACAPMSLPYTQDFEGWTASSSTTSTIDPCWTRHNNYTTGSWYPYVTTSYAHSGSKSMYFYGYTSGGYDYNTMLVMPTFADTIQNLQVSFWMYTSSSSYNIVIGVMTNPDDPSTFTSVYTCTSSTYSTWNLMEVPLNTYRGQGRYIAFKTNYTYGVSIDDITVERIPSCPRARNVTVSGLSATGATISWTSTGQSWDLEYGYPGFIPGTGTRVHCANTRQTLTGLSSATAYEVYITTNCSGGETSVSSPVTFRTSCSNGSKITSVPYIENFENMGTGSIYSKLPCWKAANLYSSSYPSVQTQSGTNALYMYIYSSNTANPMYCYIATPPIDTNVLPLRTLQVSFRAMRSNTSYMHELAFGVMTDSSDIETFDTLQLIHMTNSGIWNEYTYSLENYRGDGRFIAFKTSVYGTQYSSYPYLDDIVIEHIVTCPPPTDVEVLTSYDPNDILVSWKSWPAPANSWDIAYGPRGFSPYTGGQRIDGITDTFYVLTGLSYDTTYEVYVRSHCGPDDSSAWSLQPGSVTPGSIVMPRTSSQTYYICDAMVYDNGGPSGDYSDQNNSTLILYPMSNDSVMSISGTYSTEQNYDFITVYDGAVASGTPLARVSGSGTLSCSSTLGPLTIVFTSDVGVTMSGFELHARCVAPPPCRRPLPTVLAVESRRVTIDVVSSPAISWIMEFSTNANFTPGRNQGTTVSRGTSNFTLNGLQPQRNYYAYIRTDCGGGDTSQWSQRFSFTTPCDPATVLPYTEDFQTLSINARRDCWTSTNSYPQARKWHTSTNNKAYYFYDRNGVRNGMSIQKIDNVSISRLRTKFSLFGTDTSTRLSVGVMSNPNDFSTFVPITTFNMRDDYDWYNYEIPLSSYNGSDGYIAFTATTNGATTEFYFDNLFVDTAASCLPPVPDTIIASRTGATIIWQSQGATAWMMEYGHKGFTPGTSTVYMLRAPYASLAGMQPNSEYDVYLRTICGPNDTSEWSLNPICFHTTCEERQLPYVENFEGYYGSPYSEYTRAIPTCWTLTSSEGKKSEYRPQLYTDTIALNGTSTLVFRAPGTLTSPVIAASLDTVEADFFMRVEDIADYMVVGVVTDPTDISTFVAIDTVYNTAVDVYQKHSVAFNRYSGNGNQIAFRKVTGTFDNQTRVFIDSLLVRPMDECLRPSNITVSDITAHTARVAWTERGTATSWIIEYDTVGYTPGTGTQITVNTNPYLLTGLDSNRAYAVNVRSICTDTSEWSNIPGEFELPRCDESCLYTLVMSSNTSGWYGASVEVKYDENTTYNYSIGNRSGTEYIYACPGEIVSFSWVSGQYDSYCHFLILNGDDTLYASSGTPTAGLVYTTTCGSDTACPIPLNLTTTVIDYQTVEAGWYGTGTFEIACKIVGTQQMMWKDTVTTTNYVNTYRIDSLHPDTAYAWMVRKLCYIDSISSWQVGRFKIADNICVVPVDLTLRAVTNNNAGVVWESYANNLSWGVRCFSPAYNFDTIIYSSNKYLTITGLQSGVRYFVSVMGLCRDSAFSVWSDTIDFVTDVCDTVSGVTVTNITNTSATVSWTRGHSLQLWDVDYGRRGFPVNYGTTRQTTSPTYNIEGLEPGTTYDVYVRSYCGTNYFSVWSQRVTFTTTGQSGISEVEKDGLVLDIIPNPATSTTVLSVKGISGLTTVTITDISGKTIISDKVKCDGTLEKTVDVSTMAKGAYFVHVSNDKTSIVQKLIVQ